VPLSNPAKLDQISWRILETLQADARLSYAELGRRVGLSTPAVAERVRKLEDAGVIVGYHALLDPFKLGISIQVIVRVAVNGGDVMARNLMKEMNEMSEIVQCYRVTGSDGFIIRADVVSVQHLDRLIERLYRFGKTMTTAVLSTPIMRRSYMMEDIEAFSRDS
jgi:Lrp/AsnC family transcriptional regulator, leucine-responsive regulatory protein